MYYFTTDNDIHDRQRAHANGTCDIAFRFMMLLEGREIQESGLNNYGARFISRETCRICGMPIAPSDVDNVSQS